MHATVVGIGGPTLSDAETALFQARPPAGIILFRRNIQDPAQLRALTASLRQVLPAGAAIAVDQEGGRVARLRPPHWLAHPPAEQLGALYARDPAAGQRAAWLTGALIGAECADVGIDLVCAPVLDLRHPGMHDVVGDRALSGDPDVVATLAAAVADGLLAAGVMPVVKHAPGHGWATVDSHAALPRVPAGTDMAPDLLPFIRCAHLPWMMTAHLLYPDWDPDRPATLSPVILNGVIRGQIGFAGVLVSDDLAMGALDGPPADRATAALDAGCDLALFCSGVIEETAAVLDACPPITQATVQRLQAARGAARGRVPLPTTDALAQERAALLA